MSSHFQVRQIQLLIYSLKTSKSVVWKTQGKRGYRILSRSRLSGLLFLPLAFFLSSKFPWRCWLPPELQSLTVQTPAKPGVLKRAPAGLTCAKTAWAPPSCLAGIYSNQHWEAASKKWINNYKIMSLEQGKETWWQGERRSSRADFLRVLPQFLHLLVNSTVLGNKRKGLMKPHKICTCEILKLQRPFYSGI